MTMALDIQKAVRTAQVNLLIDIVAAGGHIPTQILEKFKKEYELEKSTEGVKV